MLYVVGVSSISEVDRFKRYTVLDLKTCSKVTMSGISILREPRTSLRFNNCAYVNRKYTFDTPNMQIRVADGIVIVYTHGITYILKGKGVVGLYRDKDNVHILYKVGKEIKNCYIDTRYEAFIGCNHFKSFRYEYELDEILASSSMRKSIGYLF